MATVGIAKVCDTLDYSFFNSCLKKMELRQLFISYYIELPAKVTQFQPFYLSTF